MAKIRVFELARDLNIPGKDLITRMKAMGFTVKGNFDALDDDQVHQIKAKMLEPVTRVEEASAALEEGAAEQPRKRRIISARRSEEVHKIQESLGISGPLPEDERTREEVEPAPPKPASEQQEPSDGQEPLAAESAEQPDLAAAGAETREPPSPAAEMQPKRMTQGLVTTTGMVDRATLEQPGRGPDAARIIRRGEAPAAPGSGGGLSGGGKQPPPSALADEKEKTKWREFKRPERKPATPETEDWVRHPRRRTHARRGPKPARPQVVEQAPAPVRRKKIRLGQTVTVSELAGAIGIKASEIIKKLMALGIMATVNQSIDGPIAELIAADFSTEIEVDTSNKEDMAKEVEASAEDMLPRPPIVTVMGHVDHGKTSLLDRIRASDVAAGEAGGITQHIGAYFVRSPAGDIVFLDTPGHEAFTSLRARGANVTDVVVLVVAADDGVMPQTVEAIQHAQAAKVPIMVAINKIDRPNADPERVKRQLMEYNLLSEELGGDTVFVPLSAKTGEGVPQLLEMIHLQSELLELKAPKTGFARGFVIEAKMDRRRGPVATVIVQRGTLRVGDEFVVGTTYGRVRAMFDDKGHALDEAPPSVPVEILGYDELPQAGDMFIVMGDEKLTRELADHRTRMQRSGEIAQPRRAHLEDFLQGVSAGESVTLHVILKADAQGSLEAIRSSIAKIGTKKVSVNIVRAAVGGISETDISLATTTNAIVIGFNVRPESKAQELAQSEGVDIKLYTIIYELIDDVKLGLQGMLKPLVREQVIGHLEVRQVFSNPKEGQIIGGFVSDGKMQRNSFFRLFRDNVLLQSGQIGSLRRFKDEVPEVQQGFECGLRVHNTTDVKAGDLIEAFIKVEEKQTLESVAAAAQN